MNKKDQELEIIIPLKVYLLFNNIVTESQRVDQLVEVLDRAYKIIKVKANTTPIRTIFYLLCNAELHRRLGNDKIIIPLREELKKLNEDIYKKYLNLIEISLCKYSYGDSKKHVDDIHGGSGHRTENYNLTVDDHIEQFIGDNDAGDILFENNAFLFKTSLAAILGKHFNEEDLEKIHAYL
tara:strand:+ start:484 stop:1026 length:543 start_codon:yes stop_codon:yes gene_type:complete